MDSKKTAQKCIKLIERELLCALEPQGKFLMRDKFLEQGWEVSEEERMRMTFL